MKIVLFDFLYDTKKLSLPEIQKHGQDRLDAWLGEDKVKFEIAQIDDKVFNYTLWREYGPWYEDPKRFSGPQTSIVDVDACIFLGSHYQTGTVADFSQHPGWCIWSPDIKSIYLPDFREMVGKHHGTRVSKMEADSYLDHVVLTVYYY